MQWTLRSNAALKDQHEVVTKIKVTADDADCEHWIDSPVGAAVPGARTLRWTRAAVLTAAEAAKRRGTLFIALPGGGRTG